MALQHGQRPSERASALRRHPGQQGHGQQRDVVGALAQRRQVIGKVLRR
jgi:hypothetical protein